RDVRVANPLPDRPDVAAADRAAVDLDTRRDLCAGAAEEHLVRDVQLRPVDRALLDGDPELPREGEDRVAGDALEDVGRDRRRDERAVADHEEVRAAALR